jgi:hypothetical protein
MSHTPGPWYVQLSDNGKELLIKPIPGDVVAVTDPCPEEAENARLICAAPELLEACEVMLQISELEALQGKTRDKQINYLKSVIKKAKGEI